MKYLVLFFAFFLIGCQETPIHEQRTPSFKPTENLVIITLDGVAWDDVFEDADVLDRNFLAQYGNLYGDRNKGNKVDVLNPSAVSNPGYAEIFTGNTTDFTGNDYREGINKTVLEYINEQPNYEGHNVMAVARGLFPYYLFRASISDFPILTPEYITFYDELYDTEWVYDNLDDLDLNRMYSVRKHFDDIMNEAMTMAPLLNLDVDEGEPIVYLVGKKIMSELHTKVNYFQFVMTDPAAHANDRDSYLKLLENVQVFIKDLISYIDSDPFYRNNTSIVITTDHGRSSANFTGHGRESFLIVLNPSLNAGIVDREEQIYNAQIAQTLAKLIGLRYEAEHEIANEIEFYLPN